MIRSQALQGRGSHEAFNWGVLDCLLAGRAASAVAGPSTCCCRGSWAAGAADRVNRQDWTRGAEFALARWTARRMPSIKASNSAGGRSWPMPSITRNSAPGMVAAVSFPQTGEGRGGGIGQWRTGEGGGG